MDKKYTIVFSIIIIVIVLLASLFFSGNDITVARCIITENGELFMVDGERPVILNGCSKKDYKTGDKLFIIHSTAYAESYPEQTAAKLVFKISDGTEQDVNQKALDILKELNYFDSSDN